jgi:hypothetical protein
MEPEEVILRMVLKTATVASGLLLVCAAMMKEICMCLDMDQPQRKQISLAYSLNL